LLDIKNNGIKIRLITEITKDNLSYCKDLMQIVSEVRHLDGVNGSFAVTGTEYLSYTISEEKAIPSLKEIVRSTSKEFVEQQQSFFETLWNKAIPAEKKIREIEEGIPAEVTETWYGIDNILKKSWEVISGAQVTADACHDSKSPLTLVSNEQYLQMMLQLKAKGVRQRFITEITSENVKYCRELAKYVQLRHLDGVKGNFTIIDAIHYGAIANLSEFQPPSEFINSTVREFVAQQQYFFETLWNKAIPAEQRIKEIEEGVPVEKTEVIYGPDNGIRIALECFARTKERLDTCCDSTMPSVVVTTIPIRNAGSQAIRRGVKPRVITEITKENIEYCKEMMRIGHEMRHLDNVKGNFSVSERDYIANAAQSAKAPLPQLIHSNVKAVIEQQQYFFETLWSKAIPAEHRIREIEEGIKPEVIETIREPRVTQERVFELIESAKEEILIIFSTSNAFRRQEKAGAVDFLIRIANSKNVKVRILSPIDDRIRNIIDKIKRESKTRIEIRNIEEPLRTKVSVLIVDRASLLSAELKNDSKETSLEAIGLATYSNSKPTVLSYSSIFESLWNQTELYEHIRYLYEQLKSHDKMKQEFMDIAAHELRTPIQPILGLAQVLKDQISDSTQSRFLDVILRNAKRLQKLQEDMLDVTRIESGSMKIRKESFNLNKLIFDVLQDFRAQLNDNARIKLIYISDGDVWVVAEKNRISQVISNLLANAIKFTKAGRILIELRKRKGKKIADGNHQVIVSIKDEGPGIDPSVMPRLFTKFASKSEKGTGLGLFISKSIIEAYDGKIWAENNRDEKGATFTFTLPLAI
jgi:two-component system sensor histidine kinase VicK